MSLALVPEAEERPLGHKWRKWLLLGLGVLCCGCCLSWLFGPLDRANRQRFEYGFTDGVLPPLSVTFDDDRDILINPIMGDVWLPKGRSVRYEYTFKGKKVSGTIPAVERGEWYMHIGPEGITVNR